MILVKFHITVFEKECWGAQSEPIEKIVHRIEYGPGISF